MTDNRDNNRGGPRKPGGGRSSGKPPGGGKDFPRSPRKPTGDRPFRKPGDGERTFRPRAQGDARPPRRDGDKPFVKREGGERTYRPRPDGEARPARADGERAFRKRPEGDSRPQRRDGDKPFVKREGGERTYRTRPDGEARPARADGERPFRKRPDGDSRPPRRDGDKPFVKREGGERTYHPRPDGEARPARADGERPFRKRPDGDTRPPRRDGDKPYVKREGGERTFRPRREGEQRPQRRDGDRPLRRRDETKVVRPATAATEPVAKERDDIAQRIAKVMARAGLCSRRDAELWIEAGRVAVNGEVLTSPAFNVKPDDKIVVDGQPLAAPERTRLFMFHKPRGFVTTDRDPEGRPTIFDALPPGLPRVVTVGRLDINTEGLLLLTNDGGLARMLELPSTGWLRRYRVRAKGSTTQAVLDELGKGVTIDGIEYAGIEARLDREQGANVWLTMGLREGKNREVKRVLEHIGLEVNRLIRISFGPFQLLELEDSAVEEVPTRVLRDQLGPTLAEEAGVDFDGPALPVEARSARPEGRGPQRGDRVSRKPEGWTRAPAPEPEEEVRPRQDRPKPGPRKHISVIRAERRAELAEGRKRIERGETSDRKGRSVKIERVVAPANAERPDTRNGRRFTQERQGAESPRPQSRQRPPGGRFERTERAPRSEEREDFRGPRPERKDRKNRFGGQGERPREEERPKSYAARSSAGRPASSSRPATGRAPGKGGKPFGKPGGKPGGRGPGRGRD